MHATLTRTHRIPGETEDVKLRVVPPRSPVLKRKGGLVSQVYESVDTVEYRRKSRTNYPRTGLPRAVISATVESGRLFEVATLTFDGPGEDMNIAEITLCDALSSNRHVLSKTSRRRRVSRSRRWGSEGRAPWACEMLQGRAEQISRGRRPATTADPNRKDLPFGESFPLAWRHGTLHRFWGAIATTGARQTAKWRMVVDLLKVNDVISLQRCAVRRRTSRLCHPRMLTSAGLHPRLRRAHPPRVERVWVSGVPLSRPPHAHTL